MAAVMVGRPALYSNKVLKTAQDYLENYREEYNHAVPSVVGLCKVLNIAKSTIYRWCEEGNEELKDTLAKLQTNQELALINGGLTNEINPTITKLMMANHGYHEKTDIDVNNRTELLRTVKRLDGSEPELIEHAD